MLSFVCMRSLAMICYERKKALAYRKSDDNDTNTTTNKNKNVPGSNNAQYKTTNMSQAT